MSNLSLINWNPQLKKTLAISKNNQGKITKSENKNTEDYIFLILLVNTYLLWVIND